MLVNQPLAKEEEAGVWAWVEGLKLTGIHS